MIIKTINGNVLYQSKKSTMKGSVEEAVAQGVDLSHGNFRRMSLNGAHLDGMMARKACFWGCDLKNADLSDADLSWSDIRNADLKDACLVESNLSAIDFSGSYFDGTILRQCNMRDITISCPSFFSCDLYEVSDLSGALYRHRGEYDIAFHKSPIAINGLSRKIVVFDHVILWGDRVIAKPDLPPSFIHDFKMFQKTINAFYVHA